MSQLTQAHHWQLGSHAANAFADHTAGSSGIAISAVCAVCGLARIQVIPSLGEHYIDLRGQCSGSPQEPGELARGEWPQVSALGDDASG